MILDGNLLILHTVFDNLGAVHWGGGQQIRHTNSSLCSVPPPLRESRKNYPSPLRKYVENLDQFILY